MSLQAGRAVSGAWGRGGDSVFSSIDRTSALSGGFRCSPDVGRAFPELRGFAAVEPAADLVDSTPPSGRAA